MKVWKKICSIIVFASVASYIYASLSTSEFKVIDWVDTLFVFSLLLIVCSAGTAFVYSPPFQRVRYNFVYFFSKLKRENKIADEVERKKRIYKGEDLTARKLPRWISSCLLSGIFLATISTIISLVSIA